MRPVGPVLVAGRTGQLASCIAALAPASDLTLVCIGRPELDITDTDSIARAVSSLSPWLIVNTAGYTAVDEAESNPERAYGMNRDAAARLAAAAHQAGVPFIHVSTDYVFDGLKGSPYRENDQPAPINVYGRSKLEGEAAVRDECPTAIILRTSWLYSRYGQNFVRTMLRLGQCRQVVGVVDDQHGCPTSGADLAHAILTLARDFAQTGHAQHAGIYHVAAAGDASWYAFAQAIFSGWTYRTGHAPRLEAISTAEYPTPARRPPDSRLDCSRIAERFGIRLPHWRHSLAGCLDELAAAPSEAQPC